LAPTYWLPYETMLSLVSYITPTCYFEWARAIIMSQITSLLSLLPTEAAIYNSLALLRGFAAAGTPLMAAVTLGVVVTVLASYFVARVATRGATGNPAPNFPGRLIPG
jgi:hypothetical protein